MWNPVIFFRGTPVPRFQRDTRHLHARVHQLNSYGFPVKLYYNRLPILDRHAVAAGFEAYLLIS